jgi:hypothetical protein
LHGYDTNTGKWGNQKISHERMANGEDNSQITHKMTQTPQREKTIPSGGWAGKYTDKAKRILARVKEQIRSALALLKQAPIVFLRTVWKEIRWLWRKSVNRR